MKNVLQIFFPEWLLPKQIEAIRFRNEFHDKSAQTDCSKEMWIPILKRIKHLNLVIGGQVLCCQDYEKYLDGFRKVECVIIAYEVLQDMGTIWWPLR